MIQIIQLIGGEEAMRRLIEEATAPAASALGGTETKRDRIGYKPQLLACFNKVEGSEDGLVPRLDLRQGLEQTFPQDKHPSVISREKRNPHRGPHPLVLICG